MRYNIKTIIKFKLATLMLIQTQKISKQRELSMQQQHHERDIPANQPSAVQFVSLSNHPCNDKKKTIHPQQVMLSRWLCCLGDTLFIAMRRLQSSRKTIISRWRLLRFQPNRNQHEKNCEYVYFDIVFSRQFGHA